MQEEIASVVTRVSKAMHESVAEARRRELEQMAAGAVREETEKTLMTLNHDLIEDVLEIQNQLNEMGDELNKGEERLPILQVGLSTNKEIIRET